VRSAASPGWVSVWFTRRRAKGSMARSTSPLVTSPSMILVTDDGPTGPPTPCRHRLAPLSPGHVRATCRVPCATSEGARPSPIRWRTDVRSQPMSFSLSFSCRCTTRPCCSRTMRTIESRAAPVRLTGRDRTVPGRGDVPFMWASAFPGRPARAPFESNVVADLTQPVEQDLDAVARSEFTRPTARSGASPPGPAVRGSSSRAARRQAGPRW
jgi:hypothetical protein